MYDGLFYWVFGPSFGYPSSAINYTNFDFNKDVDKVDDALAEPLNAVSTDLADFKRRGNRAHNVSGVGGYGHSLPEQYQLL